jgi:saccharopine dehydrogenase (NADP+, L-glutamate forming)
MASTVGLPLAISVCAYLKGEITCTGLHIPTLPEIYEPVLKVLKEEGIVFTETHHIQLN